MPTETPQPLVNLARAAPSAAASSAGSAGASTSRSLPSLETQESADSQSVNILEDMEMQAAEQGSTTSSTQHRRKRKRRDEEEEEESWVYDLRLNLQTNQTLLEKLLEDREREKSEREPFIRYVSETLRHVPEEQFNTLKDLISDILKQVKAGQRTRDSAGSSTSCDRPPQSVSAPPTCQYGYSQQQQQYFQPQPNYDSCTNWQYSAGGFQQQQQQQQFLPQQQVSQQQQLTQLQVTPRRPRDSADSMGRILNAAIAEDLSLNMDSTNFGRLSQGSMNTPPAPTVSPSQPRVVASAARGAAPECQSQDSDSNSDSGEH